MDGQSPLDENDRIELNMDHPVNKFLADAASTLSRKQFDLLLLRIHRSTAIHWRLSKIGNLAACKRREVVRALVDVFRQGFYAGHLRGYRRGQIHERRRAKRLNGDTNGR